MQLIFMKTQALRASVFRFEGVSVFPNFIFQEP